MKIRSGFVSNSSSSSFIVNIKDVKTSIVNKLLNPDHFSPKEFNPQWSDGWSVYKVDEFHYNFLTYMDNFDYIGFVKWLGLEMENIDED